jgi:hypothetical protein
LNSIAGEDDMEVESVHEEEAAEEGQEGEGMDVVQEQQQEEEEAAVAAAAAAAAVAAAATTTTTATTVGRRLP